VGPNNPWWMAWSICYKSNVPTCFALDPPRPRPNWKRARHLPRIFYNNNIKFRQSNIVPLPMSRRRWHILSHSRILESGSDCQVVKVSGLAAGKGVLRYPTTKEETIAAAREIISDKTVGTAVDTCVIESFLTGPKASWRDLSLLVVFSNSCKIHCDNNENLPLIDGENLPLTRTCLGPFLYHIRLAHAARCPWKLQPMGKSTIQSMSPSEGGKPPTVH
jgi:Phosphoribosylglycinamide synthetase, ATP-grasp (A) domain